MLWIIDLANFASVVAFADKFEKEGGDLHILVMNAAIALPVYQPTTDGWESTWIGVSFILQVLLIVGLQVAGQSSCNFAAVLTSYSTTCCCREKVINTFTDGNRFQRCPPLD
jgi:NAD(P)-dependent dehydrogenase (short-subunit alcohol dehydrogenase family)